jgi:hypothetical protein
MVAMVVGLTAVTSVYSLGAAMSEQFYEEQRTATSQGASRAAIMELRRDVSRAGLFGSPNAQEETRCEGGDPDLARLGGGRVTMGAFQYYPDADLAVLDPDGDNFPRVGADRLRVLTSLYLTDQLLVDSVSSDGRILILQTGNQAYRRTFAWGQAAGPFTGSTPDYLEGDLGWDAAWGGEAASWNGIGQQGARAFQNGSVLHIESPEGYHFFRTLFGKQDNVQNQVRLFVNPPLPVATACLPGAGEGSTVSPLQWVEYALVDPFDAASVGTNFMDFGELFFFDLEGTNPLITTDFENAGQEALREKRNVMLVRRILDPANGNVRPNTTQVLAEFVSNFEVSFRVDRRSGTTQPPLIEAETDPTVINDNPERVRSVLIDLGIRSPLEDPSIPYSGVNDANTRFEVDPDEKGSARVRHLRIEIPVMSVARRNL